MKVDVTSNDDLAAMVHRAKSMSGLDIMVNNASVFATIQKPFFEIDDDEFDLIMRVNTRSVRQVMRAITPTVLQAGGGRSSTLPPVPSTMAPACRATPLPRVR